MNTTTAKLNAIADRARTLPDPNESARVERTLRSLAAQASGTPGLPSNTGDKLRAHADYEAIRWPSEAVALWREAADAVG